MLFYFCEKFKSNYSDPIPYKIDLGGVLTTFYKVICAVVSSKTCTEKFCTSRLSSFFFLKGSVGQIWDGRIHCHTDTHTHTHTYIYCSFYFLLSPFYFFFFYFLNFYFFFFFLVLFFLIFLIFSLSFFFLNFYYFIFFPIFGYWFCY